MLRQVTPVLGYRLSVIGKEIFLCLVSALLLILSFPKYNIEVFAWVAFIPSFFALRNKSKLHSFFLAYFTGIFFWLGIIYWLIHVTFAGLILLVLYLSLYFGVFGLFVAITQNRKPITEILFLPCIWVILEYIRSNLFTGFPWALLGYSQYLNLPVIQVSDITGAWGVSFLVMMINVIVYLMLDTRCSILEKAKKLFIPISCIMIVLCYGYVKIHRVSRIQHQGSIKISVIQGNIPQELKWDEGAKDFIINKYFKLTSLAVKDKADFMIWPEASLPVVPEEEPGYFEQVRNFVKKSGIPLLLGEVTFRNNLYYNSAVLLSKEGEPLLKYDKLHLVPFGEYIPLRKSLSFLETMVPISDFKSGKEYTIFSFKPQSAGSHPVNFSVLICFEDVFSAISRQFVKGGADFLVNITNDAWFKNTSSPYQHLQSSVFRAVENRVFLVRSANTGVSGFVSPKGKIIELVHDNSGRNTFIDGFLTKEIIISKKSLSFYTEYGNIFVLLCLIYALSYLFHVKGFKDGISL